MLGGGDLDISASGEQWWEWQRVDDIEEKHGMWWHRAGAEPPLGGAWVLIQGTVRVSTAEGSWTGPSIKRRVHQGAWVAQLVERPASAQVTISWFVSLSPASGSVLTAQSLEPGACFGFCVSSLFAPPLLTHSLSVSKIK